MIASLEQITKYYGAELILDHVSLKIEDQDRIGLIGVNGAGKSTLLNILSGDLEFESGERAITSGVRIGFLRQNSGLDRSSTILAEMRSVFAPLYEIERQMEAMRIRMRQFPDDHTLLEEYNRLHTEFEAGDGYLIDVKINTILNGMGFAGRDRETLISALSGGEKTRLALCKLLLEEPELLILDEPTNHLDLDTKEALDKALGEFPGTILMVSHDRYLLSKVPTKIAEMTPAGMTIYQGGYAAYARGDRPILTPEQPEPEPVPAVPEKKSEASTTYYRGKKQRAEDAKRRKRLDTLEKEIAADEEEIQRLTEFMAGEEAASDYEKLTEAANRMEKLQQGLTAKYEEWSELSE